MASQQVSHMVRLLDDLLDVSRITHGKISLRTECIDLCETVKHATDSASPLINERRHALQLSMPAYPVWIMGDAIRLTQLFGNLLNNAAKYTPNGGVISFSLEQCGTEVVLRIKDNGVGIVPRELPNIFDMFTQVDNSIERASGGLGIGLTLVKSIAEMHGGSVEAHSEGEGKGAEFTVRLRAVEAEQHGTGTEMSSEENADACQILVVDDNEASAKTLGWMVEALGHKVELAYSAKDALSKAGEINPDIVLLDIGMPEMNGYELCRAMRAIPALKDAIYIAQTGWGQEQHLQLAREAGFDFHLTKPVRFEVLKKQLEGIKKAA
jgi:CheY-like chemotaxis protein